MVAFLTRIKSNLPNHTYIILLPYYESSFDEYFIDQNAYFHILMWFNAILKQKKTLTVSIQEVIYMNCLIFTDFSHTVGDTVIKETLNFVSPT